MNKQLIFAAIACVALAGCSNEEYLGEFNPNNTSQGIPNAINFSSVAPTITRAESDAQALGYSFQVYATKTVGTTTSNVFAQSTSSSIADNDTYWVWYNTNTANTTTSNTADWEYVGAAGSKTIPGGTFSLEKAQEIKYWDYSADQYDFIAYKSKNASKPEITNITNTGFTVKGTAAQLGDLYVADKMVITSGNYNKVVPLTFHSSGTKVRLGIYETIPGYAVRNVKFRPYGTVTGFSEPTTINNATLTGSFNGSSSSVEGTYDVTYPTSTPTFTRNTSVANFQSPYFDFGAFATANTAIGTTSTAPTWASLSSNYQGVLPNTDNVGDMILKVDYELYNSESGETITVKGAKAVVPAMYMKWNPNYAYTYLFKISDNTNGTTGTEDTSPEGIFPITFDAVTIATLTGEEGTITTVSTPAITTYQEGSVSATGITYANAKGPIYITVNTDGTLADLTVDNTKLYTVAAGTTEADLMLNITTTEKAEVGSSAADKLEVLSTAATVQGISFAANTTAKFTPTASTTYALEYATITEVTDLTANTSPVTGYYTRTGTAAPYTYTKITDANAKAADGTTYYNIVYQYKIIIVGANS